MARLRRTQLILFGVLLAANFVVGFLAVQSSVLVQAGVVHRFFGFDYESNAPTLFSVLLILQAALLCYLTGRIGSGHYNWFWSALSIVLVVLSIDELSQIHERASEPLRDFLGVSGPLFFAWVIPGALFVLILALVGMRWLQDLSRPTRNGFLLAAFIYLSGVLLFEGAGGWYYGRDPARLDLVYLLLTTAEESLEMIGLIVFGYYAARHLVVEEGVESLLLTE